jgi:hypothetical protein
MIEIKRVSTLLEIEGIKSLQSLNLKTNLSKEERMLEGFLTAEYSIDFLIQMHQTEPSIIAKDGDKVVGYASSKIAGKFIRYNQHKKINHLPLYFGNEI